MFLAVTLGVTLGFTLGVGATGDTLGVVLVHRHRVEQVQQRTSSPPRPTPIPYLLSK